MTFTWTAHNSGGLPANPVSCASGVYLARKAASGALYIGKLHGNTMYYVTAGVCNTYQLTSSYEILNHPGPDYELRWESHNGDDPVPKWAVNGGYTSEGNPLYVARDQIHRHCGYLDPQMKKAFVAHGDRNLICSTPFDLLIATRKS